MVKMFDIAKSVAIEAGREVVLRKKKGLTFKNKQRYGDFATDADLSSEKIILDGLRKHFPRHNFVSEERGNIDKSSEYTWIIDPLDGTIPYSSGLPFFGISIGLLENYQPQLGVINLPEVNCLFCAQKGEGAYINDKKLCVSGKSQLKDCVVGVEYGYMGTRQEEVQKLLLPLIDKVRYPLALGSSVAGCAYVAQANLDAYIHSAHPWDFAAGGLIATEAGGEVTDYQGREIDWSKDWIDFFASNGKIHNEILTLINK